MYIKSKIGWNHAKKQTQTKQQKQQQMKLQTSDLKEVNNVEDSRHDEGWIWDPYCKELPIIVDINSIDII